MKACFGPADILLPGKGIDLERWAVIACDQYTSQPEYWEQAEKIAKGVPSSYHLIYPEVYLGRTENKNRIDAIQKTADSYLKEHILTESVQGGFVLTMRTAGGKVRAGLIGAVDLELYEYAEHIPAPIRATEGTVLSRIPPRVQIRKSSPIEIPHVMMLVEDKNESLIEPLYKKKDSLRPLYDFELMLEGGHVCGYAVEGIDAKKVSEQFSLMEKERGGAILAVGDGNHSLAAAKAYWDELKATVSEGGRKNHPARYALVEIVNLYSEAINFEPIHRLLFRSDPNKVYDMLAEELGRQGIAKIDGEDIVLVWKDRKIEIGLAGVKQCQVLEILQKVLDEYLHRNPSAGIDYIHGRNYVMSLVERTKDAVGVLLRPMDKEMLFPLIQEGGVLSRKAFSLGEAWEKRYYLEARKIAE